MAVKSLDARQQLPVVPVERAAGFTRSKVNPGSERCTIPSLAIWHAAHGIKPKTSQKTALVLQALR